MKPTTKVIQPGATLGMLGGGQLGRMTMLAGRQLGYRFNLFEPVSGCCAAAVADKVFCNDWNDKAALGDFAGESAAVTLEFENIPATAVEFLEKRVLTRPAARVLEICQNRRREKEFLRKRGFPCTDFAVVTSASQLAKAAEKLGYPCVLKTAISGYDGKGQYKLPAPPMDGPATWEKVWRALDVPVVVIEKWIPFEAECSVIVARGPRGDTKVFPMAENEHRRHILHQSIIPARLPARTQREGAELACDIAAALGVVGLLAVELFCVGGKLLVNELAPRPHNSGHYTLDACLTSQFEQHVRCVTGLPLGGTDLLRPAVMVNLLGDCWRKGAAPDWAKLLRDPRVKLHLYDKGEPRSGRKMGHFTVLDEKVAVAKKLADNLFAQICAD